MRDTLHGTGRKTKRKAIGQGRRTLLCLKKQAEIRCLRGKPNWQGDLEAIRTDR